MHKETDTQLSASRRSLLRTGAHAAWVVPAVTVATAAPAFATSPVDPAPLPPGMEYQWSGGVNVATAGNTRFINRFNDERVFYELIEGEDRVAPGTYYTSVTVRVSWDTNVSVAPEVTNFNGWSISSGSLTPGTSGIVTFAPTTPLQNGAVNGLLLPQLVIRSSDGATSPYSGIISTLLNGTNLGGIQGGIEIP